MLWRKDFPGKIRDMVLALSGDHGATFAPASRVHDDGWMMPACPHRGGGVGIDGRGRVHVAGYSEGADGRPGLFHASSDDRRAFTPPRRIEQSDGSIPDHVGLAVQPDGGVRADRLGGRDRGLRSRPRARAATAARPSARSSSSRPR